MPDKKSVILVPYNKCTPETIIEEPRYIMYKNRTLRTDKEVEHRRRNITLLTTLKKIFTELI
jgi:hypothetical protein